MGRNLARCGKPLKADREQRAATATGQKTEVPDADESRRQYVQQESAQKFVDSQRHETLLILMSGIAPAEGDHAFRERDQTMVRDRYPSTYPMAISEIEGLYLFSPVTLYLEKDSVNVISSI